MAYVVKESYRAAHGVLKRVEHISASCGYMTFSVYLPDISEIQELPVVYFLSGSTCTDENFCQKAGAFKAACELKLVLVIPDTSPRGEGVPDEEPKDRAFGIGSGWYVDATTEKYKKQYNMYTYVTKELPEFVEANFKVAPKRSLCGHSMGGHGSLVIGLRNPERYESVSVLAPVTNPMTVPIGEKAFNLFLGTDKEAWKQYDATELVKSYKGRNLHIMVDVGTEDEFGYKGSVDALQTDAFAKAARDAGVPVTLRTQAGYNHGYYFISSFIDEHLAHHARFLHASMSA